MNKHAIRALLCVAVATTCVPLAAARAQSQSSRGQPKTPFSVTDFAKLRWIEGSWAGTSSGEPTIYSRYRVTSDSTIEIAYYSNPELTNETGTGRLYLSVGRVYQSFGSGRWGATHIAADRAYFVPQSTARNTIAWEVQSPDSWTATNRSGVSGRERVTVYHMQRIKTP
jgi:hypothetical protein